MHTSTKSFNESTWDYLFRFSSGLLGEEKTISEIKKFLWNASASKVNIIVTAKPGSGKTALVKTLGEAKADKLFAITLDAYGNSFQNLPSASLVLSGRDNDTLLESALRIGSDRIINYHDKIDETHLALMLKAVEDNTQLIYPYETHMRQYIDDTAGKVGPKLNDVFEIEVSISSGLTEINQIVLEGKGYTLRPLWKMIDNTYIKVNEPNRKIRRKIQESQQFPDAVRTDEYSEPMQAILVTPSEKEKVMRLLSGEWDYIINDGNLQKEKPSEPCPAIRRKTQKGNTPHEGYGQFRTGDDQ